MIEHFASMFDDRYGYPGYFSLDAPPAAKDRPCRY